MTILGTVTRWACIVVARGWKRASSQISTVVHWSDVRGFFAWFLGRVAVHTNEVLSREKALVRGSFVIEREIFPLPCSPAHMAMRHDGSGDTGLAAG